MLLVVVLIVVVYSALFQYLMSVEGREYSWSTSVYWTLVTMSTLGYGDIVFDSEMGPVFTSVVLQIPDQNELFPSNAELLLIGEDAVEQRFVDRYVG
ncbi:hypothetical protein GCM10009670_23120 [Citricoccus alkalitolerans]